MPYPTVHNTLCTVDMFNVALPDFGMKFQVIFNKVWLSMPLHPPPQTPFLQLHCPPGIPAPTSHSHTFVWLTLAPQRVSLGLTHSRKPPKLSTLTQAVLSHTDQLHYKPVSKIEVGFWEGGAGCHISLYLPKAWHSSWWTVNEWIDRLMCVHCVNRNQCFSLQPNSFEDWQGALSKLLCVQCSQEFPPFPSNIYTCTSLNIPYINNCQGILSFPSPVSQHFLRIYNRNGCYPVYLK